MTAHCEDLGRVRCSLVGNIPAGSWQTCQLTYTSGFAGIDDTGSLKLVMRYATDCGTPQFDDPSAANYTSAVASNGAHLALRWDVKDNVRPWGKTLHVKVLQGYLKQGETITLTLGDTTGGGPGWRMQTFAEKTLELRMLVDRFATYVYQPLEKQPEFRIVAGEPVRLVAVAPSLVLPGRRFDIRWRLEDRWGNPVGRSRKMAHRGFPEAGCHTVEVRDENTGLEAETNPVWVCADQAHGRFWADLHGQSEETIGTGTVEEYFRFARDRAFIDIASHQGNDFQITDAFWQHLQEVTAEMNRPGRFVTFPGWEWSGNTGLGGDRNVVFSSEGGAIYRSSRALVEETAAKEPTADSVEELFDLLEGTRPDPMLIAHVGGRYADLARHREGLERAVEVHSAWGTFEWMLEDAFELGYRVAIVANSDGHKGRPGASWPGASTFGSYGGLTCVLAEKLDRPSVWEAYRQRRVYATTGARIGLDVVTDDGVPMGSVIDGGDATDPPAFRVDVRGTAPIERVEFRNGTEVIGVERPWESADVGDRVKLLWRGATVRGRGRQVIWDGRVQVPRNRITDFVPINFHNIEKSCRRAGANELAWESITTGGVAGVITTLARPRHGTMTIELPHGRFRVDLARLGPRGRRWDLGGLGQQLTVCRLPPPNGTRHVSFVFRPRPEQLHEGDNPLYVHVVQEDGHMAWSSPVYLVR
ncbi:MAG: DUF3604 domain-containing protein [Planctomycetaceae bacterium]|nr:MAG: DUF3604 domain-containing protein [Planctomycetaceae bacterium]